MQEIRAIGPVCELGESPFWHPMERKLYWCDIAGRRLMRMDPCSEAVDVWQFESEPACCAPTLDGRLLLGMRDGLWKFDPASGRKERLSAPPYDPCQQRFNDGKCDPQGRMWLGALHEPKDRAAAALYCWVPHEGLDERAAGVTTANGLAWSPDSHKMYWADTRAHRIDVFDFDASDGSLSGRRPFFHFDPPGEGRVYQGRPDGAAVDTQGFYWVAMYEGGQLIRLSPQGEVVDRIELPVVCPTMPCFGGDDLRTLYVTSARKGRPALEVAAHPHSGQVLTLRVEVPGLPVNFAQC